MENKEEFYRKIIKELNLDNFLEDGSNEHKQEKQDLKNQIEKVLTSVIFEPKKTLQHTRETLIFLKTLWKKYDCIKIANFFEHFARIEPTLLSLGGTRDHFLHIYHVFLFGLRIISKIISIMDTDSQKILKIKDENDDTCVFPRPYNYKERIFYLWTLASTFHDIGYPLQYLPEIKEGFQKFSDFCNFKITPLNFQLDYSDITELESNFRLISRLYGGKLKFSEIELDVYEKIKHTHFHKVLISAFRERNHGILSAIILLRLIERIYLFPKEFDSKHPLTPEKFNKYTKYFYNNDIARAALIISIHNLKGKNLPEISQIKFSEFPLAFILILADEFQEFLRKKTNLGDEKIILKNIPNIDVIKEKNGITIKIKHYLGEEDITEIKKDTKREDLKEALDIFWQGSVKSLEKRLSSETNYKVNFEAWEDNKIVYEWIL